MKKIVLFLSLLLFNNYCFAANTATLQDSSGNVQGTSGNPVHVSLVGGGGGGSSLWETNSVGIDTFNPVGIGNTNPGVPLDVQGTIRTTSFTLTGNNAAPNLVLTATDSAGDTTWSAAGAGTVNSGTAGQAAYYASSTNAVSGTSNIIISGSNVGIGSPTPGSTLDVQGTLRGFGTVSIGTTTSTNVLDITGAAAFGTYGGNKIAPANGLAVSGNVGIGTFSAVSNLAVKGSVAIGTFAGLAPVISNGLIVSGNVGIGTSTSGGATATIYDTQGSILREINTATGGSTSGAQAMLTSDNATPSVLNDRLGLLGFAGAKDSSHTVTVGGAVGGFASGTWTGSSIPAYLTLETTPSGSTTRAERMRIDSVGNIGIGSTAPGNLLDVKGTVRITGGGHFSSSGTAPTVVSNDCGSTVQGTIVAKSTDISGTVTVGTLTVTSCAVTFTNAWLNAPNCIVVDDTSILTVRPGTISTTKLTINSTTSMSGDNVTWFCTGNE